MIKIEKLNKKFKEFHALKGIDLHIKKGEIVLLKGVSGSGKSTLLTLILALQKPTSGDILIEDESISKLPDLHTSKIRLAKIGFVPQDFKLIESLTASENISIPLIALGFSPKEIETKCDKALNMIGIKQKARSNVKDLSGGEKQRVAIARAIVGDPKILLFDEPTANLDRSNSINFIDILRELKILGKTIVIATHDPLFDSVDFIDKIYHIQNGEIADR